MTMQNMAPNAKRSLLLSSLFGVLAALIYLFGVQPTQEKLGRARQEENDIEYRHTRMKNDLAGTAAVEKRIAEAHARLQPFREAFLEPLLESTAMRAKSLIDPLALGAELHDLEYEALPVRALPLPPKRALARQLFVRSPIRLVAQGSYQSAISFLLRLEREFPLVILESMTVTVQNQPNVQKIEMILEWPAKGAVTQP